MNTSPTTERDSRPAASAPPLFPAAGLERGPASGKELRSLKAARRDAIDRFEIEYLRALLQRAEGNVTRAAALAGVSRQVIHKLLAKHRARLRASSDG